MTEVRRLRKERGLTQAELARIARLSQMTISRMEMSPDKRKGGISISSAVAVARALEVEIDVLFHNFVLNPTQGRPAHTGTKLNLLKHVQLDIFCPKCNTKVSNLAAENGQSECCEAELAA